VVEGLLAITLLASDARAVSPAGPGLRVERFAQASGGEPAQVILLRVPPRPFEVRMMTADPPTTAPEIARRPGILAVINAGYFDAGGRPLGLVAADGVLISPVARRGWGTFVIRSGVASVHSAESSPRKVDQGVQAGPRLVVGGRAATLRSPVLARRSFVGIDRADRVVLGCAQAPTTLQALAHLLARPEADGGPDLVDALNLDGGSSTQMLVRAAADSPDLLVPGVPVPTFLVVELASPSAP
jgi:exopolysaccharide biosynthesis protein